MHLRYVINFWVISDKCPYFVVYFNTYFISAFLLDVSYLLVIFINNCYRMQILTDYKHRPFVFYRRVFN